MGKLTFSFEYQTDQNQTINQWKKNYIFFNRIKNEFRMIMMNIENGICTNALIQRQTNIYSEEQQVLREKYIGHTNIHQIRTNGPSSYVENCIKTVYINYISYKLLTVCWLVLVGQLLGGQVGRLVCWSVFHTHPYSYYFTKKG